MCYISWMRPIMVVLINLGFRGRLSTVGLNSTFPMTCPLKLNLEEQSTSTPLRSQSRTLICILLITVCPPPSLSLPCSCQPVS
ncbi:hypothetical protein VTI74DRAFT_7107 [Chaetomium olivicolor]